MAILSFIINAVAILMIADGIFILVYPEHIEKLVKDAFPKLNVRQVAVVELIGGIVILAMRSAAKIL